MKAPLKISNLVFEDFTLEETSDHANDAINGDVAEDPQALAATLDEPLDDSSNAPEEEKLPREELISMTEAQIEEMKKTAYQNGFDDFKNQNPIFYNSSQQEIENSLQNMAQQIQSIGISQQEAQKELESELVKISLEIMQNFISTFDHDNTLVLTEFWNQALSKISSEQNISVIIAEKLGADFANRVTESIQKTNFKGKIEVSLGKEDEIKQDFCKIIFSSGEINYPNIKNGLNEIFNKFVSANNVEEKRV